MIGRFDVAISKFNLFEDCIEHTYYLCIWDAKLKLISQPDEGFKSKRVAIIKTANN